MATCFILLSLYSVLYLLEATIGKINEDDDDDYNENEMLL